MEWYNLVGIGIGTSSDAGLPFVMDMGIQCNSLLQSVILAKPVINDPIALPVTGWMVYRP